MKRWLVVSTELTRTEINSSNSVIHYEYAPNDRCRSLDSFISEKYEGPFQIDEYGMSLISNDPKISLKIIVYTYGRNVTYLLLFNPSTLKIQEFDNKKHAKSTPLSRSLFHTKFSGCSYFLLLKKRGSDHFLRVIAKKRRIRSNCFIGGKGWPVYWFH
jgi:hypothetical protein